MQMPENGKMSLGLIQRYLVLQVNVPQSYDFSTELLITDSEHLKRRLHLSTVHKELSTTLLHAKIPFVGLKRNAWSTLCIDLVSLACGLFKGFLTLEGITLFATCKVRRIFTMKGEPVETSNEAGLVETIPRSFLCPPDIIQSIQVLNIESLRKAEIKTGLLSSYHVSDQSPTARSTSYRRTRPQGILHTASGSRVSELSPQTASRRSATSCRTERSAPFTRHTGSPSDILDGKITTQKKDIAAQGEDLSHGASCKLQPCNLKKGLFDRKESEKICVLGPTKEKQASSDVESAGQKNTKMSRKKCAQQHLTPTDKSKHLPADKTKCTPAKQSPGVAPTPAKSHLCLIRPDLSSDLRVQNSWEGNKRFEPQLTLQEEAFTFSSKPHSPKRGRGQADQEMMETRHDLQQSRNGRRHHPQPKDDFIGSESDEDKSYPVFHHKKCGLSCPATPTTTETTQHEQLESHSESSIMNQTSSKQLRLPSTSMQFPSIRRAGPAGLVPTRCLSPNGQSHKSEKGIQPLGGNSSVSVSRKLLQEIRLDDSKHHKEQEYEALKTVDSSHYLLRPHRSLRMDTCDDEELRMLASLRREQEEDECSSLALSTSQIHQCAVSISMSSDDTSTWTHMSTPINQGHHYQKEMNPLLLLSNPREWMDVLSPPIMPPSQQRRSGNTQNNLESRGRGQDGLVDEEGNEDDYLNLLYDPCLSCYFDPKTGKYYELCMRDWDYLELTRMSEKQAGLRLHPGIIASVILVSMAAVAAAVLIIRKYCFPVNEATYRYSVLRQLEDQQSAVTEEDGDRGPGTVGEESDEDLLE
ncbi:protein CFAP20DC [Menidia menidia]